MLFFGRVDVVGMLVLVGLHNGGVCFSVGTIS